MDANPRWRADTSAQRADMAQVAAVAAPGGSGLWRFWLSLTGPRADAPQATIQQRTNLRRARLSSSIILGMFLLAIGVLPLGLEDPTHATLGADVLLFAACVIAAALNRFGQTTAAGMVLVLVLMAAIMGAVLGSHFLDFIFLPAFDLLALVVIVAALVLPRWLMWVTALLAMGFVVADLLLQPRSKALETFVQQYGPYSLMGRPVIAILITAILVHLLSSSLEVEIQRGDRAEEIAALEHAVAEQRRQLEIGAQQILETHVRVANGDFSARAMVSQGNMLWQVAASLNNLLGRLQKAGQAEYQLRRTEDELRRLATAIDDAQGGKHPIWPAPSGTAADLIIERIVRSRPGTAPAMDRYAPPQLPQGSTPAPPFAFPSSTPTQGQLSQRPGWPGMSSGPGGQGPSAPDITTAALVPPWVSGGQGQMPGSANAPDNPWFVPPDGQDG
jgi:hypothetical protein